LDKDRGSFGPGTVRGKGLEGAGTVLPLVLFAVGRDEGARRVNVESGGQAGVGGIIPNN